MPALREHARRLPLSGSLFHIALLTLVLAGCSKTPVSLDPIDPRKNQPTAIARRSAVTGDTLSVSTALALARLDINPRRLGRDPTHAAAARLLVDALPGRRGRLAAAEVLLSADPPLKPQAGPALQAAALLWPLPTTQPYRQLAMELHAEATGRIVSLLAGGEIASGLRLPGPFGEVVVPPVRATPNLWFEDVVPDRLTRADLYEIRGIQGRYRRAGVGAACVGYWETTAERLERHPFLPLYGSVAPLTAALQFPDGDGSVGELRIWSPRDSVNPLAEIAPAAADWSAPISTLIAGTDLDRRGRRGMRNIEKESKRFRIFLTEPYHPDRIPVVFVHGLRSSPVTWRDTYLAILGDDRLRRRYQAWFFMYPTGLPVLVTAETLRRNLHLALERYDPEGNDRASREMVIAAHSMGGLLARTLIQNPGDRYWSVRHTIPFDEYGLDPRTKEELRPYFFFERLPQVKRVIFVATPHRGSKLASGLSGKLGTGMVKLPDWITDLGARRTAANPEGLKPEIRQRLQDGVPTSIDDLDPRGEYSQAFASVPLAEDVVTHTIVGDRGRRRADWPLDSSDGVVKYGSSHLAGVASELIVPTGHFAHQHPLAIEEIRRILHEHLDGAN